MPEIAHSALDLCTNSCDAQNVHVNEIVELYFLLGEAEFYNQNRTESLSSLKMLMDYHNAQYTHFVKDVCKTMVILEVACFLLVWEEANNVTCSIISFIFSSTFDTDVVTSFQDQPSVGSSPSIEFLSSQLAADAPLYVFYVLFIFERCIHLIQFLFSVKFALCIINYIFIFLKMWMSYHLLYYTYCMFYSCLFFIRTICDLLQKIYSDIFV